jgi:hypothetical protein
MRDGAEGVNIMEQRKIAADPETFVESGNSPPQEDPNPSPAASEPANTLKERFVDSVGKWAPASFADIAKAFPEEKGDSYVRLKEFPTIVLWRGFSKGLVDAIRAAVAEKLVLMQPTSFLTYIHDGRALRLPLARKARHYKSDHWLPVVLYRVRSGIDPSGSAPRREPGREVEARSSTVSDLEPRVQSALTKDSHGARSDQ